MPGCHGRLVRPWHPRKPAPKSPLNAAHRRAARSARYAARASLHGRGAFTPTPASFALDSTLNGGRRAGAPNCSLVVGDRSTVTPAWRKISAANSYHEHDPPLVTWNSPLAPQRISAAAASATSAV